MKRTLLAAAAVACVGLAGCTVMTDKYGRDRVAVPVDGLPDSLTSPERVGAVAQAASPLLDLVVPGLGVAVTGVLGGLGYGVRKGRQAEKVVREEADKAWDQSEARTMALMSQAPTVNSAEVSA